MNLFQTQYLGNISNFVMSGASTRTLNSATTWIEFSFIAHRSGSISKIRTFIGTKIGTPTDIRACLVADNGAGKPDTAAGAVETAGITPAANEVNEFIFPSAQSVIKGQMYHVVFKNYDATPASNYCAIYYFAASSMHPMLGTGGGWGFFYNTTTTGDGGWGSAVPAEGCAIEYTDGFVIGNAAQASNAAFNTTGSRLVGNVLTIPKNILFQASGLIMGLYKVGSPTFANPVMSIYQGSHQLAQTTGIPLSNVASTPTLLYAPLEHPVTLQPGSNYRVVMSVADGSAANYLNVCVLKKMMPVDQANRYMAATYTISTDGGATWAETPTDCCFTAFIGEPGVEFLTPPINRRTSTGR